jgi:hypothetical protein
VTGTFLGFGTEEYISVIFFGTEQDTLFSCSARWTRDIHGTIYVVVLLEYLNLWDIISDITLQQDATDTHIWRLSTSGQNWPMKFLAMAPTFLAHGRRFGKPGHRASTAFSYGWWLIISVR